jgi:CRP-like cAMP-binding protein
MGFPDFESKGIISTAENFGQYEFVTDLPRLASAMAIQYSHVYYLERQTFIDSISKLPAINVNCL